MAGKPLACRRRIRCQKSSSSSRWSRDYASPRPRARLVRQASLQSLRQHTQLCFHLHGDFAGVANGAIDLLLLTDQESTAAHDLFALGNRRIGW